MLAKKKDADKNQEEIDREAAEKGEGSYLARPGRTRTGYFAALPDETMFFVSLGAAIDADWAFMAGDTELALGLLNRIKNLAVTAGSARRSAGSAGDEARRSDRTAMSIDFRDSRRIRRRGHRSRRDDTCRDCRRDSSHSGDRDSRRDDRRRDDRDRGYVRRDRDRDRRPDDRDCRTRDDGR